MSVAWEMAQRLAREAEAVCRHYLPHGRREGRYWRVGDVHGTPGENHAEALGIEALVLAPVLGDLNDDLLAHGIAALRAYLRAQLAPEDVARFWAGRDRSWGA